MEERRGGHVREERRLERKMSHLLESFGIGGYKDIERLAHN